MKLQKNEIVGRLSYQCDMLFRVIDIIMMDGEETAILYGEDYRLIADAPLFDLVPLDTKKRQEISKHERSLEKQSFELFCQDLHLIKERQLYETTTGYQRDLNIFQIPGRVLHIDGDPSYLRKCLDVYKEIGVPVIGVYCQENEMPNKIDVLLDRYRPDILVITGHDAYSKSKGKKSDINAYRNSKFFAQTVHNARKRTPNLDQLIIFAGACQSHFESLIRAGANFASSPSRINIHALDPVYIVSKISFTPFQQSINVWDALKNTLTGDKGLGGIETKGILRTGMPYQSHIDD
ncbi:spore coat assembly protein [Oikeobacillus pervagus]|uniref:Spore coat assembly protein n=1 Tax=Oikeobacillus pervagus TaxID=1325931 RepID=A0AAJ1T0B9_9BACI|nr:sporulation peptidase YabG [Oikeobacillus pervagus]MDQ0216205.1 spore coat assembly protein [Oikeobacillus pervagus]